MFVAKHKETGARITSLASLWQSKYEELRSLAASEKLVCIGCKQLLRYRSGEQRRSHFSHRKLLDCQLSKQSSEVIESKAQLYEWLESRYPGKVDMDVDLRINGLDRFADLTVRPDPHLVFTYWVFDRAPKTRFTLLHNMPLNVTRHCIFTSSARKINQGNNALFLTAGQRACIWGTAFDEVEKYGHLHFLDIDHRKVFLYRGLRCDHEPNVYKWKQAYELALSDCRICPHTGEIVADGERSHDLGLATVVGEKDRGS